MGKSVLFIHGLGGSGEDWNSITPSFENRGWRCEKPTLFQHLRCRQNPPEALNNLGFNDWVKAASHYAEQLTEEEGEKPLVVGHCLGGLVAQKLVEFGDVHGGVFINPIPDGASKLNGSNFVNSLSFASFLLSSRAPNTAMRTIGLGLSFLNGVHASKRPKIIANMRYESTRLCAEIAKPETIAGKTANIESATINLPTLTIGGGKNRAVPARSSQMTANIWQKAQISGSYSEYPQLGHWAFMADNTGTMFEDIARWADTLQAPPSENVGKTGLSAA